MLLCLKKKKKKLAIRHIKQCDPSISEILHSRCKRIVQCFSLLYSTVPYSTFFGVLPPCSSSVQG